MRCLSAVNISLRGKISRKAIFLLPLSRNSATGKSVKLEAEADQENTCGPEPPSYLELAGIPKCGWELFCFPGRD